MEVVMTNLAVDLSGLDALVQSRIPAAVRVLGEAVRSSCDPYVPYRTGRLANSAVLESSGDGTGASLTWTAPYASECYYASRAFNQKIHPHACAHWFEAAKAADNESLSPVFLRQAAIIYEDLKKNDKALELYEQIKSQYPQSAMCQGDENGTQIDAYIESLKK